MRYADCCACWLKILVVALLYLSSLCPAPAGGKSLASRGVAQDWLEMTRLYRDSSVYMFQEFLTALQMNVTEFAHRSGQREDRLHSYMKGELSLDEMELDAIMRFVDDVREIVRKFYSSTLSLNTKASRLLYGVTEEVEDFKQHAQIETAVRELRASGEELTAEQERLIKKVDDISYDAFARLKHGVTIADINHYCYRNKGQTSAETLTEILTSLKMAIPELATDSDIYAARLFAHQRGEIIFDDADLQKITTALDRAIDRSFAKPRQRERHRRLKLLLQRLNDAVPVERYLRDRNR